ncbi:hypothetical protein AVEN_233588-1, partial [Araneus ventricosus]
YNESYESEDKSCPQTTFDTSENESLRKRPQSLVSRATFQESEDKSLQKASNRENSQKSRGVKRV